MLRLHYSGSNNYMVVNGVGVIKFKAKHSERNLYPSGLSNVSKECLDDNIKKTSLYEKCVSFSN